MSEINFVDDHQTSDNLPQGGRGTSILDRDESFHRLRCGRRRRLDCYSHARVVASRLLATLRKFKVRKNKKFLEETKKECDRESTSIDHQRISSGDASGHQRQEMTFNVAAGLTMLSLIATSQTELNKTVELRKEMEVFLTNAKDGLDSKSTTPRGSQPEFTPDNVSTTIDGLSNLSSYSQEDHATMFSQQERHVNGIDRLEEELAAELELLQLDIETEEISEIQEHVTEISSNTVETRTVTVKVREATNPNVNINPDIPKHSGVPPLELERRLHELLESRQEERIKELETAVDSLKIKLQHKEEEIIWWKDMAELVSKQFSESYRTN